MKKHLFYINNGKCSHIIAYRSESMHYTIANILLLQTKGNTIILKVLQNSLAAWVVQRGSEMKSRALGSFSFQRKVSITLFCEKLRNKFSDNWKHSLRMWVGQILIFFKYSNSDCNFYLNSVLNPFQVFLWLQLHLMALMTTCCSQGQYETEWKLTIYSTLKPFNIF